MYVSAESISCLVQLTPSCEVITKFSPLATATNRPSPYVIDCQFAAGMSAGVHEIPSKLIKQSLAPAYPPEIATNLLLP